MFIYNSTHLCINDKDNGSTSHDYRLCIKVSCIKNVHMVCPRQVPDLELNEGAVGNICINIENKNIVEFQENWYFCIISLTQIQVHVMETTKLSTTADTIYMSKCIKILSMITECMSKNIHFYLLSLFCLQLPEIMSHLVTLCEKLLFEWMFSHS